MTTFESLPVEVQEVIRKSYHISRWWPGSDRLRGDLAREIEALWPEFREGKEEVRNGKLGRR